MVAPHCVQPPEGIRPAPTVDQSIAREGLRTPDHDCAPATRGRQSRIRANTCGRATLITSPQTAFRLLDALRKLRFLRASRSSNGMLSVAQAGVYWPEVQRLYSVVPTHLDQLRPC